MAVSTATAEDLSTLRPGARLRLRLNDPPEKVTGTLVEIRGDQVVLSEGPAVALARVERIQVSNGRGRRWRAGAAVGALVGLVHGSVACVPACAAGAPSCDAFDEGCAIATTLVTATLGSLGGLLVVHERWGEVSLEPRPARGGAGVCVRLAWR